MKKLLPFVAILSLSACATPESRIRAGLVNAGLSTPMASCMAQRLVDRLSLQQLRRLQSIATLRGGQVGHLSIDQLLHRTRALGDPEILSVVTSAGIRCAISS